MNDEPIVFVVDDDPPARDSVAAMIAARGVATRTFSAAKEFLQAYRGERRACLVTDVRMPEMTGLELQVELVERAIHLPVILITGHGDIATAVRAMRSGAYSFLEKDCGEAKLWESIEEALNFADQMATEKVRTDEVLARLKTLTPDEGLVMRMMITGKQNKQIENDTGIRLRTVELRRATVFKKLEVDSLPALVRLLTLLGEHFTWPEE